MPTKEKGKKIDHASLHDPTSSQKLDDIENEEVGLSSCVICLENVSERATSIPCKHDNFDFLCLISWLQERNTCPLCKALVASVEYNDQYGEPKVYRVEAGTADTIRPVPNQSNSCAVPEFAGPSSWIQRYRAGQRYPPRQFPIRRKRQLSLPPSNDMIILRRKRIYELGLYSLHVGSNRLSGYSELTPVRFTNGPHLVSRARKWIRRELQVFDFLASANQSDEKSGRVPNQATTLQAQRASSNAEFLLEYIIAILKTVDIKGSKGQAQEMLADFLGEKSALFLHELNAWLRSPYEDLAAWDRGVAYAWSEGEERALKRSSRDSGFVVDECERDSGQRRRVERWVPD